MGTELFARRQFHRINQLRDEVRPLHQSLVRASSLSKTLAGIDAFREIHSLPFLCTAYDGLMWKQLTSAIATGKGERFEKEFINPSHYARARQTEPQRRDLPI
jgi:hypothetical protein